MTSRNSTWFVVQVGLGVCMALCGCSSPRAPGDSSSTGGSDNNAAGGSDNGAGGTSEDVGGAPAGGSGGDSEGGAGGNGSGGTAGTSAAGASGTGGRVGPGGAGGSVATGGTAGSPPAILPVPQTCPAALPDAVAPAPAWKNVTGNLARMASECGNLTMLSANPCSTQVIAGVARGGLHATVDGGATWTKLGTGAGSATIVNRPLSITYDPSDANIFYESGIYNSGGAYKTTDAGVTFKQLGTITHNDLLSIDFHDPARGTLLAGGHEQKQRLYLSTNNGVSFTDIGTKLPANSHFSTAPLILNASTFLVGACGYGTGLCGVYRSTDTGNTWTRATTLSATAQPLWASDGAIYWPLVYDSGLIKSTDQGANWTRVGSGLVTAPPIELPDHRIVTLNKKQLQLTADGGKTWKPIGDVFPFQPSGVVYSAALKTFFIWHWDCGGIVLADAIASAGWDYKTQ